MCNPPPPSSCASAKVALGPATSDKGVAPTSALGVGDVNGDGKADLVAVYGGSNATVNVLLNKGDGTFGAAINVDEIAQGYDVVVADFNGDCKADILVPSPGTDFGGVDLLLSNGDGTFHKATSVDTMDSNVLSLVAADFNHDGRLDFAEFNLGGTSGAGIQVSLRAADGSFGAPTTFHSQDNLGDPKEPRGLAAGDLDGDGAPELVLASPSMGACVLKNDGNGGFTAPGLCNAPSMGYTGDTVAVGDVNGDGKADVVLGLGQSVTNGGPVIDVYFGKGDDTLADPIAVPYPGGFYGAVTLVDVNNDKKLDLVVYYGGSSLDPTAGFWVYLNEGSGKFPAAPAVYGAPIGIAQPGFGDFLGNGLVGMAAESSGVDVKDDFNVFAATCRN
jgi:hypothetical protein